MKSNHSSLISKCWWRHKNNVRKMHCISKQKLAETKCKGGLGFRDLQAFNTALKAGLEIKVTRRFTGP